MGKVAPKDNTQTNTPARKAKEIRPEIERAMKSFGERNREALTRLAKR